MKSLTTLPCSTRSFLPSWGTGLLLLAVACGGNWLGNPAQGAGMLVAEGGAGGVLEIKNQDVRVTINNSIAVTQIDQTFVNTENRIVEALYTFPVPRGASVSNFSMWINGKEMIGEVVEKERARKIYNSYKRVKRDPGLLEQVDFKQFEMRIFPILAGAEQRVRIEYYQELQLDHDWGTYVYPLATQTAGRPIDTKVQGRFSMNLEVLSEVPIQELRSESHTDDFVVAKHTDKYAQASMELTEGDLSRDIVLAFQTKRPRTGIDVITSQPKGEAGYFMMTVTPGEDLSSTMEAMDYVFLLDISGSMARDEKLALSRRSVAAFIESLSPEDRFECLAFNLQPTPLFQGLQTANQENLDKASQFFAQQRARGGTVLAPALQAAYGYRDSDRPLNVVLLSDGMTEPGEQAELLKLIQSRPDGVRVFCVGVGNEVNRPLLNQLATQAGGLAAFVSTEDSFRRQAHLMRQKLIRPAIANLSVNFSDSQIHDVEPQQLGNLFYGTPLRLLGRFKSGGPVEVMMKGQIQGAPWEQTVTVTLPTTAEKDNSPIERMWAFRNVSRLLDEERSGVAAHKDEIVRLCEGYSIVSPYASMLVLENDQEYKRWKIEQRNATRIERDRASRQRVANQLAALRDSNRSFVTASDDKPSATKTAPANPSNTASPKTDAPAASPAQPASQPSPSNVDLNIQRPESRSGGGGAIDPITAMLAISSAGAAALAGRRRKRNEKEAANSKD
ncbi:Vault protein inter-alpha-trypsin [Roseimaritima multifibrata]|uniref:Vault protein inter-alpha-trypsin n=1 Tax=Roseimaritima multifibrata TaxID=1930274 RepID=A0A517MNU1_9BACT|nr:VIT and VWA domain-containing protein [Roseimaritima multifibrata]QDS96543.1 Vault protein inter-alpha-trypsin [Roseimaritima multifibrata]